MDALGDALDGPAIGLREIGPGAALAVELGPGLLGSIYDGIQRPLDVLQAQVGAFLSRGVKADGISRAKTWHFVPTVAVGAAVERHRRGRSRCGRAIPCPGQ